MKSALILVIALLSATTCRAQHKTIIIDTLEGHHHKVTLVYATRGMHEDFGDTYDGVLYETTVIKNAVPSLVVSNIALDSICLTLDDKAGTFCLNGINNIAGDTIRIDKWRVFKNGLDDSTVTDTEYYRVYNDSMVSPPYKVEKEKSISENKGKTDLKQITVTINGKKHIVPIKAITPYNYRKTYHDYRPEKVYNEYLQNRKPGKVYEYIYSYSSMTRYINTYYGEVNF